MRLTTRPLLAALTLPLAIALAGCGEVATSPPPSPGETPAIESPTPETTPDITPEATPTIGSPAPGVSPGQGEVIDVIGLEYRYEGVPATAAVGTEFRLQNDGQEVHEIVLIRRNPDVTMSFEELLLLPEDEAMRFVSVRGVVIARPGETSEDVVAASEPGDYLMICFVPTGMTELPEGPDASIPPGPPHFTLGMLQELSVE
jgi:hypothetical protein